MAVAAVAAEALVEAPVAAFPAAALAGALAVAAAAQGVAAVEAVAGVGSDKEQAAVSSLATLAAGRSPLRSTCLWTTMKGMAGWGRSSISRTTLRCMLSNARPVLRRRNATIMLRKVLLKGDEVHV